MTGIVTALQFVRTRAPADWSSTLIVAAGLALAGDPLVAAVAPSLGARWPALGGWSAVLLVAGRWLQGLPDGRDRARRAHQQGRGRLARAVLLLVPAELLGILHWLALTVDGCLAAATRRAPPARPAGLHIEDRRKGMYDAVFVMNLLSFAVEVPVMFLVMHGGGWPAALQAGVHVLEAALVVFVVGDRWQVRAGGHVLTATHLDLRAGERASARLPLEAIGWIEPLPRRGGPWAWRQAHGVRRADTGTVSVLDTPNLAITLRDDVPADALAWRRFQVERPMPRHLLVYVDDPATLAAAVRAAAPHLH